MRFPRFRIRTLAIATIEATAIVVGLAHPAYARRGGWSKDPFWFNIEFNALAIALMLCAARAHAQSPAPA